MERVPIVSLAIPILAESQSITHNETARKQDNDKLTRRRKRSEERAKL
jgi:hypothetical protein